VHNGEHPPLSRRPAHTSGPGRHRQPGDHPVAYRDVFAVREFRALWSAQALSCAGDQFAQVAIAFVVYSRTHSAFLTAAAYALTYLPPVIAGPVLSGLADLIPRQQMMITLDLVRAGLVALMALPGLPFAGLCALFFGTVLLSTPFSAARSALLPDVLTVDKYPLGSVIGSHTTQLSQIAGFLAGGGLIAALGPYRALALDSLSFSLSAGILACAVRPRPVSPRSPAHPSPWEITWEGVASVFGSPVLRTLVLFGWLAGFTVVPEALAAPYAHILGGGAPAIGLLMAAMPAGTVIGGFVIGRLLRPSDRMRPMGWLAMLSCAPLIFSLAHPPLGVLVLLWALAGAGGAYQLAAAAAFVTALPAARRVRAFAVAQSGLLAAQGLGILTGGAVAQRIGAPGAVALAGLLGLLAASALATDWTRRYAELISMLSGGPVTAALAGTGPASPAQAPASLPAGPARPALAAEPMPPPPGPPVLNLPVAERGTGLSAAPPLPAPPPPPLPAQPLDAPLHAQPLHAEPLDAPLHAEPLPAPPSAAGHGTPAESGPAAETGHTLGPSPAPEPDRAPGKGTHRGPARRAPRDLSVRAWLAATRLLDQVLGDRRALPFLWDEDPRRQVHQHEDADRHQAQGDENQPDHGGVDADVLTDPGADASHETTFPCPD
jgi:MFS family permease